MPAYTRPGVYVEENLDRTPPPITGAGTVAVFVAAHNRGPTTPTLVNSWTEFTSNFGAYAEGESLALAVSQFLGNGGRGAYILRVAAADAATATRTFQDQNDTTPANTLQVSAASAGAWGNRAYIEILAPAGADTFTLNVYFDGVARYNLVESWAELSMDPANRRYVESIVNGIGGSKYITVSDMDSATAAPANRPAAMGPTALATGTDGSPVQEQELIDALPDLDAIPGPLTINLVDVTMEPSINLAISYVEGRGNSFLVVDPPLGSSPADVLAFADSLDRSEFAAVYYPWIHVADPRGGRQNATVLVPPGPSVAGRIGATDAERGVFKAPAGLGANIAGAVALERELSESDLGNLNAGHVNAIRSRPGSGIVVFGARTLERSLITKYVPVRRTLNYLKDALVREMEWALFEPNDELLWEGIQTTLSSFLNGFWAQGGLRGGSPNAAYYVKCDAELNTATSIEQGQIRAEVGVALQTPGEFLIIQLGQWDGGSSAVEIA